MRNASIRARSSRKWIARTGVTPGSIGWSVNTVGDAWYTVTRRPATSRVPSRGPPPLASTAQVAVPEPVPAAPDVTVRKSSDSLAAVHAQAGPVDTLTSPVPAVHNRSRRNGATV